MIFMWPSGLMALAVGLVSRSWPDENSFWSGLFLMVFAMNMMVITFDFPRGTILTFVLGGIAAAWLVVWLNARFGIVQPLKDFVAGRQWGASPDFFFALFATYAVLLVAMAVATRFDYWEVFNNRLVHHHGLWGNVEEFPTANLRCDMEITDFFEYILGGAGTIILHSPGMTAPVRLSVLGINRTTRKIGKLLEQVRVQVDRS